MPRLSKKTSDGYNRPFAVRLRTLLDEKGISQAELADKLSITRQAISAYTLGTSVPDIERAGQIADYFDVCCEYLLGKTDCKHPEYAWDLDHLGLTFEAQVELMKYKEEKENGKSKRLYTIDLVNYLLNGFYLNKRDKEGENVWDNFFRYNCNILRYMEGYFRSSRLSIDEHFFYSADKRVITQREYLLLSKEEHADYVEIPLENAMKSKYFEYLTDSIKDTWKKFHEFEIFAEDEDEDFFVQLDRHRGIDRDE